MTSKEIENSKLKSENYPDAAASPLERGTAKRGGMSSQFSTVCQSRAEGKSQDLHYAETQNRLEEIINSQLKKDLLGMSLAELQQLCEAEGMPKFAAKQICDWLYAKRVDSIDAMTNLSLKARSRLNEIAYIGRHAPVQCQVSKDGTKKYLFEIENGELRIENCPGAAASPLERDTAKRGGMSLNSQLRKYVEAVYIPELNTSGGSPRATLCISCQVGCKMGCRFCVTGQQGFHGNLTASDILNQIFSIPESSTLTNIVYMGMGEPMDNLDSVLRSTEVLTASWGLGWSPHRITVSSVGIIPGLRRFLDESQCHLAISLHNPFADERMAIMPMQKAYPIADIIALLRRYDWSGQRRISFEYTMLRGLNDTSRHAAELVRLLKGISVGRTPVCRVNLIRFHSSPDAPYKTSTPQAITAFQNYLNAHGITCTLRASRGEDIMAACGLLAGQKR